MYRDEYADCLKYIDSYWDIITQTIYKDNPLTGDIGLPNKYLSPNVERFRNQFYWDSYFMMLGILGTKKEHFITSMVNNFIYLFDRFTVMPNLSHIGGINRSQPPFFSDMVLLKSQISYSTWSEHAKKQLENDIKYAKKEYDIVWTHKDPKDREETIGHYHHTIPGLLLSRYGDRDAGYAVISELESGWDLTSRFGSRCDEFLPVDLNSLLFRYEQNFIFVAKRFGQADDVVMWEKKAAQRKKQINMIMWNEKQGFFFDYRYASKKQSEFLSLAGFLPLWAGLASSQQAKRMVLLLKKFETEYGLTITAKDSMTRMPDNALLPEHYVSAFREIMQFKQWDFPNSWPPLDFLVVIGLLQYGFTDDANRLMKKYIKTHSMIFRKYNRFFEKVDAVTGDVSGNYHYANQGGFGWTNAVFSIFVQLLDNPVKRFKYFPVYYEKY